MQGRNPKGDISMNFTRTSIIVKAVIILVLNAFFWTQVVWASGYYVIRTPEYQRMEQQRAEYEEWKKAIDNIVIEQESEQTVDGEENLKNEPKISQEASSGSSTGDRLADKVRLELIKYLQSNDPSEQVLFLASFGLTGKDVAPLSAEKIVQFYNYLKSQGDKVINCAIAAVKNLFGIVGIRLSQEQVEKTAVTAILVDFLKGNLKTSGQIQLSMESMQVAARAQGMELVGSRTNLGGLAEGVNAAQAVIAHLNIGDGIGHFVVVTKVGQDNVTYVDSDGVKYVVSREEFGSKWTGDVLSPEKYGVGVLLTTGEMETIRGGWNPFKAIWHGIKAVGKAIWHGIKAVGKAIWHHIKPIAIAAASVVAVVVTAGAAAPIIATLHSAISTVAGAVVTAGHAVAGAVVTAGHAVAGAVQAVSHAVVGAGKIAGTWAGSQATALGASQATASAVSGFVSAGVTTALPTMALDIGLQLATTRRVNFGEVLKVGAIAFATAGALRGLSNFAPWKGATKLFGGSWGQKIGKMAGDAAKSLGAGSKAISGISSFVSTGITTSLTATALDISSQLISTGKVNWKQTMRTYATTFLAGGTIGVLNKITPSFAGSINRIRDNKYFQFARKADKVIQFGSIITDKYLPENYYRFSYGVGLFDSFGNANKKLNELDGSNPSIKNSVDYTMSIYNGMAEYYWLTGNRWPESVQNILFSGSIVQSAFDLGGAIQDIHTEDVTRPRRVDTGVRMLRDVTNIALSVDNLKVREQNRTAFILNSMSNIYFAGNEMYKTHKGFGGDQALGASRLDRAEFLNRLGTIATNAIRVLNADTTIKGEYFARIYPQFMDELNKYGEQYVVGKYGQDRIQDFRDTFASYDKYHKLRRWLNLASFPGAAYALAGTSIQIANDFITKGWKSGVFSNTTENPTPVHIFDWQGNLVQKDYYTGDSLRRTGYVDPVTLKERSILYYKGGYSDYLTNVNPDTGEEKLSHVWGRTASGRLQWEAEVDPSMSGNMPGSIREIESEIGNNLGQNDLKTLQNMGVRVITRYDDTGRPESRDVIPKLSNPEYVVNRQGEEIAEIQNIHTDYKYRGGRLSRIITTQKVQGSNGFNEGKEWTKIRTQKFDFWGNSEGTSLQITGLDGSPIDLYYKDNQGTQKMAACTHEIMVEKPHYRNGFIDKLFGIFGVKSIDNITSFDPVTGDKTTTRYLGKDGLPDKQVNHITGIETSFKYITTRDGRKLETIRDDIKVNEGTWNLTIRKFNPKNGTEINTVSSYAGLYENWGDIPLDIRKKFATGELTWRRTDKGMFLVMTKHSVITHVPEYDGTRLVKENFYSPVTGELSGWTIYNAYELPKEMWKVDSNGEKYLAESYNYAGSDNGEGTQLLSRTIHNVENGNKADQEVLVDINGNPYLTITYYDGKAEITARNHYIGNRLVHTDTIDPAKGEVLNRTWHDAAGRRTFIEKQIMESTFAVNEEPLSGKFISDVAEWDEERDEFYLVNDRGEKIWTGITDKKDMGKIVRIGYFPTGKFVRTQTFEYNPYNPQMLAVTRYFDPVSGGKNITLTVYNDLYGREIYGNRTYYANKKGKILFYERDAAGKILRDENNNPIIDEDKTIELGEGKSRTVRDYENIHDGMYITKQITYDPACLLKPAGTKIKSSERKFDKYERPYETAYFAQNGKITSVSVTLYKNQNSMVASNIRIYDFIHNYNEDQQDNKPPREIPPRSKYEINGLTGYLSTEFVLNKYGDQIEQKNWYYGTIYYPKLGGEILTPEQADDLVHAEKEKLQLVEKVLEQPVSVIVSEREYWGRFVLRETSYDVALQLVTDGGSVHSEESRLRKSSTIDFDQYGRAQKMTLYGKLTLTSMAGHKR